MAETTTYYEGLDSDSIVVAVSKVYDRYRNITRYSYEGIIGNGNAQKFTDSITYKQNAGYNMVSLPETVVVFNHDSSETFQSRTAEYDNKGHLTRLTRHNGAQDAVGEFSYDNYGNMVWAKLPANANSQRLEFTYSYDPVVHTYPVIVTNSSLGFVSTTEYEYLYGKPTKTTDINGNEMWYGYDPLGRTIRITAPYEQNNPHPYTIRMDYTPHNYSDTNIFQNWSNPYSYANTRHYDPEHPGNDIITTVISDGWGRMLQTKKDAEISGLDSSIVTGRVVYDCFGRTVAQYHPFTEAADSLTRPLYNPQIVTGTATVTKFDIMDRPVYIEDPMNHVIRKVYGFSCDGSSRYFSDTTIDAKNNKTTLLKDGLGLQVLQVAPMNTVTRFEYDAVGQLRKSTDPDTISTTYTYDMLGRLIRLVHPDAGIDRYHYDAAGNLTSHVNALSDSIQYRYHYNQLTDVMFPRYPANNVHYLYGTSSNSAINAVGKVTFQEDASGWQTFKYGKLGEVTENIRTFALPFDNQTYTFKMQYVYDSWNRIDSMIYPDGEVVKYRYDLGGMLDRVTGKKMGNTYTYIDSIRYNKFGQKHKVYYGNGTRANYDYDSLQRLKTLVSYTATNEIMQQINYTYDSVGNITSIDNSAGILTNGLGGQYHNNYRFDSLYRLVYSRGNWYGTPNTYYELEMSYLPNGRVSRKALIAGTVVQTPSTSSFNTIGYDNIYHYANTGQPNTLTSIDNGPQQLFGWDAAGNMTYHMNTAIPLRRFFCWDEQNHLQGVRDDRTLSVYQYDANGDRTYKLTGDYTRQNVSGRWHYFYQLDKATLYASPYLVVTPQGYTKHYYAESERIATKLGNGGLNDLNHPLLEGNQVYSKLRNNTEHAQGVMYQCLQTQEASPSPPLSYLYNLISTSINLENECFWYHPDHLGSSSWITSTSGGAVQHLHYLPWGEEQVNQRHTVTSAFYTFSAKEKDSETGLSYFGSRYYNSDLSIWLSVDPMASKYPSLSPYSYCANNPVKLVDPNGDSLINPYKKLISECNAIIMELKGGIKGQKYNYPNLARAALETTKQKLDEYTNYSRKAEIAISALKEDPDFYNILNNLKDERGTPVDIYIYINPNLPSEKGRDGECIEDVFLLFDSFCGFKNNKVDMILSGYDIGMSACHEGGHIENDVKGYTKQLNWIISHGYANDPNYSGHEKGNPSGEKANQREREYKQRHNIPYD